MAPAISDRSFRIRGLKPDTSIDWLKSEIGLCARPKDPRRRPRSLAGLWPTSSSAKSDPMVDAINIGLAQQGDLKTSTVSYPTSSMKAKAMKSLPDSIEKTQVDDKFNGVTVLHTADTMSIDICAVHGLGGNAFDTWMAESKMWLRDLLPTNPPFDRSRIMTFGYDAALANKKSNDRIKDWADELLGRVGDMRTEEGERDRPIIFICHSMGGLVGRLAMSRLRSFPEKFRGIKLEKCGLIFFSTPHSGTKEADWNTFLTNLSELVWGVRSHEIVEPLRSFNNSSVDSAEEFAALVPKPPFHCFCEGEKTSVLGRNRDIVTQASAGFDGQVAEKILKTDHRSVCKFETKLDGYMPALNQLKTIRESLLSRCTKGSETSGDIQRKVPGFPSIVAPHYPPNKGAKWYEGNIMRRSSQLIGRKGTLDNIIKSLQVQDPPCPNIIALTGIGGIGKTEILLEIALHFRNLVHVFCIQANDRESLDQALLDIATSIGHDLLSSTRSAQLDIVRIWRTYEPNERIRAFKAWLGHPHNRPNLFLIDDLDGFKDETLIKQALPREAQIILYSTRDPSIISSLEGYTRDFHIPTMDSDELTSLMVVILRKSGRIFSSASISENEIRAIAESMDGHALGACRAMTYILRVLSHGKSSPVEKFLTMLSGSDWQARFDFFSYKPTIGLSIMETFAVSLERIRQHKAATLRLLELLAFLTNRHSSLDFRDFLDFKRPWLEVLKPLLPDYDVFARGLENHSECLGELENVSLGIRPSIASPLQIHFLWLECIQQRAGSIGRIRWIRQILILCHGSWARHEEWAFDKLRPFVVNATYIATRFGLQYEDLMLDQELRDWIDLIQGGVTNPFEESESDSGSNPGRCADETLGNPTLYAQDITSSFQEGVQIAGEMTDLRKSCRQTAHEFSRYNFSKMSDEAFSAKCNQFLKLLMRLRSLEENSGPHLPVHAALHHEIYDSLIEMAPTFQHKNPGLAWRLMKRKAEIKLARLF